MEENVKTDPVILDENGKKKSFERSVSEIEAIVAKLNSGSVQLDEMIALYEKGIALSDHCMALLAEYDGRIEKASAGGGPEE
ncbi:MAG: exodeoxyribonuclease VII small subunit [Clostridia bacterium]|nr:exodeoxyribonuclease VII small subunit [Clostridia bacterium]